MIRNLSVVKHVSDHVMLIHVGKLVGASNTYKIFNIPKQPNGNNNGIIGVEATRSDRWYEIRGETFSVVDLLTV